VVIIGTCAENGGVSYWGVESFGWTVCLRFETTFGEGSPTLEELRSVTEYNHGKRAAYPAVVFKGLLHFITVATS
jgi:hypothetical protein